MYINIEDALRVPELKQPLGIESRDYLRSEARNAKHCQSSKTTNAGAFRRSYGTAADYSPRANALSAGLSLIAQGNGTIHVLPIEQDRHARTVAELWIPIKPDYEAEIHLNTAMVEAGYAYHYQKYSGNCVSADNLGWAEKIAKEDKLGVWNGNY